MKNKVYIRCQVRGTRQERKQTKNEGEQTMKITQEEKRETIEELRVRVVNSGGNGFLLGIFDRYHADKENTDRYKAEIEKRYAFIGEVKPSVRPIGFSVDYKGLRCKVAFNPKSKATIKVSA